MTIVLGVDAGNTKTIAVIADGNGRILGTGRANCGDIYALGDRALLEVDCAVQSALGQAALRKESIDLAGFSMAGADWPEDFTFLHDVMKSRGYGRGITIINDAIGALWAGSPNGWGVSIACGTGGAIGSCSEDGKLWHSSFWLGTNSCGGSWMADKVLDAVYQSELGVIPPTALTARVLKAYGMTDVKDLLRTITKRNGLRPRPSISLSRVLLDVADEGDVAATTILHDQSEVLGCYAIAAARQTGIADKGFPLVLSGGVLRHPSTLLADAISARVLCDLPAATPIRSAYAPVLGALILAVYSAGPLEIDEFRGRIRETQSHNLVFETG